MAQSRRGCGCALAVLIGIGILLALVVWKFFWPWVEERWTKRLPPPSGSALQVHVLDVGQGDAVLVIAPSGKTVLVDAGTPGSGKKILDAMRRYGVGEIDLMVATHAHADHIGGADEVIRAATVRNVLDSKVPNTTKNYQDFLLAIEEKGVTYIGAEPGRTFDLGDGAILSVLAPVPPFFTKDQLRSGGNEPNANSVVARLDYGEFSMLLTGDAEAQTEQRLINNGANLTADVLKVGHHGSKYATSDEFIRRGKFKAAIISASVDNRYGHPSQEVLDRLRAANVQLYRTDLQGEITITTRGDDTYEIKPAREATEDMWAGRAAQRDDSSRSGFVAYGDFGPAPKPKKSPQQRSRGASGGR
ncbi:MAG TPA: ComEC/Rec2 family competence protein [Pyrinomonadaceae bacterium]|nr:ComEC/Rec2 family competence protein [Pyrinomonadaceae bacterium]